MKINQRFGWFIILFIILSSVGYGIITTSDIFVDNSVTNITNYINGTQWNISSSKYMLNDSDILDLNESKLNQTIIGFNDTWNYTVDTFNTTEQMQAAVNGSELNGSLFTNIDCNDIDNAATNLCTITPGGGGGGGISRPYCTIDIRNSKKTQVHWDITDADDVGVHYFCESDTYKIVTGGEMV